MKLWDSSAVRCIRPVREALQMPTVLVRRRRQQAGSPREWQGLTRAPTNCVSSSAVLPGSSDTVLHAGSESREGAPSGDGRAGGPDRGAAHLWQSCPAASWASQ